MLSSNNKAFKRKVNKAIQLAARPQKTANNVENGRLNSSYKSNIEIFRLCKSHFVYVR